MSSAPSMGDSHRIVEILKSHDFAYFDHDDGPEIGVEVGCFRGETSLRLFNAFPRLALYMVDPWREFTPDSRYVKTGDSVAMLSQDEHDANRQYAERITSPFYNRRTMLRLTSEVAVQRLGGRKFDFVFIDGDHSYEAVKQDCELWWPMIRPGGILAGHDYGHPRNAKGLFGVNRAVDEFCLRERVGLSAVGSCWSCMKPAETAE